MQYLPTHYKCAVVLSSLENKGWDIAKAYESMINFHFPETVIVFEDKHIASTWLRANEILQER